MGAECFVASSSKYRASLMAEKTAPVLKRHDDELLENTKKNVTSVLR